MNKRTFLKSILGVAAALVIPTMTTANSISVIPNTSLDIVNVRLTVAHLRKELHDLLFQHIGELNNFSLRKDVTEEVTKLLSHYEKSRVVYDYAVICNDSNNTLETIQNNQLIIDLAVKFTNSIDFTHIRTVVA